MDAYESTTGYRLSSWNPAEKYQLSVDDRKSRPTRNRGCNPVARQIVDVAIHSAWRTPTCWSRHHVVRPSRRRGLLANCRVFSTDFVTLFTVPLNNVTYNPGRGNRTPPTPMHTGANHAAPQRYTFAEKPGRGMNPAPAEGVTRVATSTLTHPSRAWKRSRRSCRIAVTEPETVVPSDALDDTTTAVRPAADHRTTHRLGLLAEFTGAQTLSYFRRGDAFDSPDRPPERGHRQSSRCSPPRRGTTPIRTMIPEPRPSRCRHPAQDRGESQSGFDAVEIPVI